MQYLKQIDQFGIVYTPRVQKNEEAYKSALGGLISIILYGIAFSYFIYKIYMWQTNQILANISNAQATNVYQDITFGYQALVFTMTTSSGINPFDPQNLILIPIQLGIQDSKVISILPLNVSIADTTIAQMKPQQLRLILNAAQKTTPDHPNKTLDQQITFFKCSPDILDLLSAFYNGSSSSFNCAPQKLVDQYMNAVQSHIYVTLLIGQFNSVTRTYSTIDKNIYLQIDPNLVLSAQILISTTEQTQDTGFIFESRQNTSFASDFQFITQTFTPTFAKLGLTYDAYATFIIRLNSVKYQTNIIYPKLGSILADVGSIVTTLFTLKVIVTLINSYLMLDGFYMQIIQFYYPKLKNLKIKKNLLGKTTQITYKDKEVSNVQEVEKYIDKLKAQAELKLTALNAIYELSRLQFIVQSLQSKEQILQSHKVGINLNIGKNNSEQQAEFNQVSPMALSSSNFIIQKEKDELLLDDDDFHLISIDHPKSNQLKSMPVFYQKNCLDESLSEQP